MSQSFNVNSMKQLLTSPKASEKPREEDCPSSGDSITLKERQDKGSRFVSVILQIPELAEMEGVDADAVRYVSPAASSWKWQRSVVFSPACLGRRCGLPACH